MNGGPAGDLQVQVSVRPHPLFERDGYDIWCDLPLTFAQVALGAEVKVPTLDGSQSYTIREGTQPGDTFRLKGKGFPFLNGRGAGRRNPPRGGGSPQELTGEQKKLRANSRNRTGERNYQKRRSFFDKLKDAFNN